MHVYLKPYAVLLLFFTGVLVLFGQVAWEGLAAQGSREDFPVRGQWVLSDNFPPGTIIQVVNVSNNRKISARVVGQTSNNSYFLLISEEAAFNLDITPRSPARVRISLATRSAGNEGAAPMFLPSAAAPSAAAAPSVQPSGALLAEGVEPAPPDSPLLRANSLTPVRKERGENLVPGVDFPSTSLDAPPATAHRRVPLTELRMVRQTDVAGANAANAAGANAASADASQSAPPSNAPPPSSSAASSAPPAVPPLSPPPPPALFLPPPPTPLAPFLPTETKDEPELSLLQQEALALPIRSQTPESQVKESQEQELERLPPPRPSAPAADIQVSADALPVPTADDPSADPPPVLTADALPVPAADDPSADALPALTADALPALTADALPVPAADDPSADALPVPAADALPVPAADDPSADALPVPVDDPPADEPKNAEPNLRIEESPTRPLPIIALPERTALNLDKDAFYIQVGAFRNLRAAEDIAVRLQRRGYSAFIYNETGQRSPLNRILVGPVPINETGSLLVWIRSQGFQDAFSKKGNAL